ncbi:MAG: type III-B CRISPR-associated protein Cas10/Cmr2 [Ktedonobacteraceae bacterium]|nr:type III-B CRISPR-associated protein Cas10/Cmr2 [Ktedonobacteraceae bacterium]
MSPNSQTPQYLLMFSLGPVQSFIAQARKARDLWLGSFLLSLLMEASMQNIERSALIFPAALSIDSFAKNIPDLPNKYVACFPCLHAARETALNSTRQIEERWLSICEDVWQKNILPYGGAAHIATRTIWERQICPETLFEIFWVIVERHEKDYHTWLRQAQEALAARKRSRTVKWHSEKALWNEPGEKSTISGERETLRGQETSHEAIRAFWRGIAAAFPQDLNQNGEERLDAIDTVKRFAFYTQALTTKNIDPGFPSTSSIATASYVKQLLSSTLPQTEIQDWLHATREPLNRMGINALPLLKQLSNENATKRDILRRDGDCFFAETFTPHHMKKDYAITSTSKAVSRATDGQKALGKLLVATDRAGIARPTPYYAMILMDGDKMGPLVGGVENAEEHNAISRAVSAFSRKRAPAIVQEHYPARLIYAGGDDAFALAPLTHGYTQNELLALEQAGQPPLKTVLNLVDQLQQAYRSEVRAAVQNEERKRSVTASIGIAIAHHYTALSSVRRIAKEAEELAKKHYGRNALVVTILRRSGEQTRVGCHWEYIIERNEKQVTLQPLQLFATFYELFTHEFLSPRCVYMLLEEAPTLIALDQQAQQSEITRILQRQPSLDGQPSQEFIRSLAHQMTELAHAMDNDEQHPSRQGLFAVELHAEERRYGLIEIIGWLLVLLFLARKEPA